MARRDRLYPDVAIIQSDSVTLGNYERLVHSSYNHICDSICGRARSGSHASLLTPRDTVHGQWTVPFTSNSAPIRDKTGHCLTESVMYEEGLVAPKTIRRYSQSQIPYFSDKPKASGL